MEIPYPGQVSSTIDTDPVYVQLTRYDNMLFKFSKAKINRLFPSSLLARTLELDSEVKIIPIDNPIVIPEALSIVYQIMEESDLIQGSAKDKEGVLRSSRYLLIDVLSLFAYDELDMIISHTSSTYILSLANPEYVASHYEQLLENSLSWNCTVLTQYVLAIIPPSDKTYDIDVKYFLRGIALQIFIPDYLKRINPQTIQNNTREWITCAGTETCVPLYMVITLGMNLCEIWDEVTREKGRQSIRTGVKYLLEDSRVRDDRGTALSMLLKSDKLTYFDTIKMMIDRFQYDPKTLGDTIFSRYDFYDRKPDDFIQILRMTSSETCRHIVSRIIESPGIYKFSRKIIMTILVHILTHVKIQTDYVEYMIKRISSYSRCKSRIY